MKTVSYRRVAPIPGAIHGDYEKHEVCPISSHSKNETKLSNNGTRPGLLGMVWEMLLRDSMDRINLTVGDEVKHVDSFEINGVLVEQTRYGKVLAKNGSEVLVALANFGVITETVFNIDELKLA